MSTSLGSYQRPDAAAGNDAASQHVDPVCIVDDDGSVCDSLIVVLDAYGFKTLAFASPAAFLADERRRQLGCLIIDQHMPEMDGLEVVSALHREGIAVPTVLITGRLDAGIAERAHQLGLVAVLEKPFVVAPLVELLRAEMERRR